MRRFATNVVGLLVLACVLFGGVCYVVRIGASASTWPAFALQVAVVVAAFVPVAWFVLVPRDDRRRLWRHVRPASTGTE